MCGVNMSILYKTRNNIETTRQKMLIGVCCGRTTDQQEMQKAATWE